MSLLLDARKKAGLSLQGDEAVDSLGLNIDTPLPQATRPAPASPIDEFSINPARATGENLFAAKVPKPAKPARKLPKLGLVPLTFLICSVVGSMYGAYVWYEVSYLPSHAAQAAPSVAVPSAPPAQVVAAVPPPPAPVLTVPVVDVPPVETVSAPSVAEKISPVAPRIERKPRGKKASVNTATSASETRADIGSQGIRIEHKQDLLSIDPLLLTAYQAYRAGDFKAAEQQYREVLRKDAQSRNTPSRDALLGLAAIAQQQSQDALAAQYYGQVLAQDPRDPQANAGMLALRGASDGGMSESRLKTLLVQHPESAALHFSLGNQYAEQMRWNEAQQAYFNAYSLAPDSAQFAFNLAVSLDHLGQRKLAAQHYQRALQLDSGHASFDHTQTQKRLHDLTVAP